MTSAADEPRPGGIGKEQEGSEEGVKGGLRGGVMEGGGRGGRRLLNLF